MPIFGMHDRSRFEVICIMVGVRDRSEPDVKIASECEHYADLGHLAYAELAAWIAERRVHILVNLNGFTQGSRNEAFALEPAPVQLMYLGYAGTMGQASIPQIVVPRFAVPPERREGFTEKLVVLPGSFIVNHYRDYRGDVLERASNMTREAYGLPPRGSGTLFCNFNNNHKLDKHTFLVWLRILGRVPGARMWMQRTPKEAEVFLKRQAEERGIDPDRFVFTDLFPIEDHLSIKSLCDVFLDSPLYNSHTTALEALWAAVPIITLPLATMTSRIAASEIRTLGLGDDLVATSLVDYERKAVALATSPRRLAALRARLVKARLEGPLFDTNRWVEDWEATLQLLWEVRVNSRKRFHIIASQARE